MGVGLLFDLLLGSVPASASHKPLLGDGSLEHDYFDSSPYVRVLVYSVESLHFHGCPHNKEGSWGDIAAGRYDYALEDMLYLLNRIVNHPPALRVLGVVAKLIGDPSLPLVHYRRALDLFPQHAITFAQYGEYLVEIGQTENGIQELQRAVQMQPRLTLAHVWLARAYAKTGQSEHAQRAADEAVSLGYRDAIFEASGGKPSSAPPSR